MDIIQSINKNKNLYKHLICKIKICLTCDYDDESWNKLLFAEKMFNELDKKQEIYLQTNAQSDYNILINNYYTVEEVLNELKDDIVGHYKMASIIMLDNMKYDEISKFYEKINKVMKKYINLKNASEDVFYYSGKDIANFISKLLKYIKSHDIPNIRFIPVSYLEQYENIITIDYKDWITLIKTLRSTMKYLNDINDEEMSIIKDLYILINVYYFIVITGGSH